MEGFFGVVLGYGISIWVIVKIVKFINRLFSDPGSSSSGAPQRQYKKIIYNKKDVVMEGFVLRKYIGKSGTLIVPRNTLRISNVELPICDCTLSRVFIPRSVKSIAESALDYCEDIYYEGSEMEWQQIDIGPNNFNWWIPKEYLNAPDKHNHRINTEFHYNWPSIAWDSEEKKIEEKKEDLGIIQY